MIINTNSNYGFGKPILWHKFSRGKYPTIITLIFHGVISMVGGGSYDWGIFDWRCWCGATSLLMWCHITIEYNDTYNSFIDTLWHLNCQICTPHFAPQWLHLAIAGLNCKKRRHVWARVIMYLTSYEQKTVQK